MIKAVVFDYGGVLSRFGAEGEVTRRIAQVLGCDERLANKQLSGLIGQWVTGKIATGEFWKESAELVGAPEADYDGKWKALERGPYEHLYYDFARALRQEHYVTGILSNVNPSSETMIRNAGGYRDFSPVLLSCEVKLMKPDPAIFRLLLQRLQLEGEEIVFVDDNPANLAAAQAFGIRTVQAHDPESTIRGVLAEISLAKTKNPA